MELSKPGMSLKIRLLAVCAMGLTSVWRRFAGFRDVGWPKWDGGILGLILRK